MAVNDSGAGRREAARRRLLGTLVAGGGVMAGSRLLPDGWRRPVVERVLLPAHAQATGLPGGDFSGPAVVAFGGGPATAPGSLLDLMVGSAHASGLSQNVTLDLNTTMSVVVSYSVGATDGVVCISGEVAAFSTGPLPLARSGDDLGDVDYEPAGLQLREQRLTPGGVRFSIGLNGASQETWVAPPGDFVCPEIFT